MRDQHLFMIEVGEYMPTLRVVCPYAKGNQARPCWPHDLDGNPDPAPNYECTYESWVDNLSADELLHGNRELWLGPVDVRWESDSLQIHLQPPRRENPRLPYIETVESPLL